jgi:asparagine synthase (glutamine-hydrolysing)
LLLWVADRGGKVDAAVWGRLCERACAGLPSIQSRDRFEWQAPGCAALAIRTRSADPTPLRVEPDGRLLLADAREPIGPSVPEQPPDDPGAIVVVDPLSARIRLLRDRLGQRPLAYARVRDGWLIASREATMLAHAEVDRSFDDAFLATHFALIDPKPGHSLFRGIRLVEHGTRVDLEGPDARLQRVAYEPDTDAAGMSDADAARRFRDLLQFSVANCCRGADRLGLQLSAGLDSSSIAVLLPGQFKTSATLALNYGTTLDGGIDERPLARRLAGLCGLSFESIDTADHPASLAAGPDRDPAYPYLNPYRPLKRLVHGRFSRAGCDVVLTGDFGDHWEAPARTWLVDALANGRFDVIRSGLVWLARHNGLRGLRRDAGVRYALRRWTRQVDAEPSYDWLNTPWRDLVQAEVRASRVRFSHWPIPAHAAYNLGSLTALDAAFERHYLEPQGFDLRYPWRNWPLIRFALSLPAYQSSRNGIGKWLARSAVADVLPAEWSARPKLGDLRPLLDRLIEPGIRRAGFVDVIDRGRSVWERFVEPSIIKQRLDSLDGEGLRDGLLVEIASFSSWLAAEEAKHSGAVGYCAPGAGVGRVPQESGDVT